MKIIGRVIYVRTSFPLLCSRQYAVRKNAATGLLSFSNYTAINAAFILQAQSLLSYLYLNKNYKT